MKKIMHVSLILDSPISSKNKELFIEDHNLKDFLLQTNLNEYKIISFSMIEVWEPKQKEEGK